MKQHLAQINIAQAKADLESEVMSGFVNRLDEINQLAEQSPGFVWRLTSEEDEISISDAIDSNKIINLSLWDDINSLENYVYKTAHVELLRDRKSWFNNIINVQFALWWVPAGHIPSIDEGYAKLDLIEKQGSSADAFSFAKPF